MAKIKGSVEIKITSASPPDAINHLNNNGIQLQNIRYLDDLNVLITVERSAFRLAKKSVESKGDTVSVYHRMGWYWSVKQLIKRPVLIFTMILFLILTLYLPSRVLFVAVCGNEQIPTNLILDGAENCGIVFGASRRAVRSEKMKNRLLAQIPELKWAGINTYGCLAVISVEEKTRIADKPVVIPFGNMIAERDAVVTEISVLRGTASCTVGQAVKKGQQLISGYEDLGICIKGVGAKGEVYGKTSRDILLLTPTENTKRTLISKTERRHSILLGKKLINFSKFSGISDSKCVRMYSYKYIYLPGGLRLPIALVTEEIISYDFVASLQNSKDESSWVKTAAQSYVTSQMLAGEILNSYTSVSVKNGVCSLYGVFQCHEMIGRVCREEIVGEYG